MLRAVEEARDNNSTPLRLLVHGCPGGPSDTHEDTQDRREDGLRSRLTIAPESDGYAVTPLRWLIVEEVGALNPINFQRLERELRANCPASFPNSRDGTQGMRTFAGLNVILVGDFHQMDPVKGPNFWKEDANGPAQVGIDILCREFSNSPGQANLLELTEQCRVLDAAFEKHVLHPLRTTDDGPTPTGLRLLRSRIVNAKSAKTQRRLDTLRTAGRS
eukprot:gene17806-biopygen1596